MVYVILSARHRAGLATAFHKPPDTQLQMLQPSLSATRVEPVRISAPKPAAGAKRLSTGSNDVGALDLYFLLASRLPAATAIQAADAWANGRDLVSEQDHHICTDLAFAGRDVEGRRRIATALQAWSAAMPAGAVTLGHGGLSVHVCDPGTSATAPPNSADDALGFAADRAYLESAMVEGGIPPRLTRCMADHMVTRPDYQQFVTDSNVDLKGAALKRFQAIVQSLAEGCAIG
jgi:hypothetical protein